MADRSICFTALTNFASGSPDVASYILNNTKITPLAYDSCRLRAPYAGYAARLLANLSRHLPDHVYDQLYAIDKDFLTTILSKFVFWLVNLSVTPNKSSDAFAAVAGS